MDPGVSASAAHASGLANASTSFRCGRMINLAELLRETDRPDEAEPLDHAARRTIEQSLGR